MPEHIEFVRNYQDQSTDRGFQYEFFCDRCGGGMRTEFKASATGAISDVLDTASSLLGGIFGRAANVADRVHDVAWERAHDKAFISAIEEIKPYFIQCPHCLKWICREKCWNEKKGLCKECAPDMGVEMSAAQASKSREEVWAHAKMSAEDKQLSESNWRQTIVATCPQCEKPLQTNAKFCPHCGSALQVATNCAKCGTLLQPDSKFCAECGTKTS
jgi:hypothetical protein